MNRWTTTRHVAEFLANIALFLGIAFALFDVTHQRTLQKKADLAAALDVYRDVDTRYTEFVKLCIEEPQLDCYSMKNPTSQPLNPQEQIKQKILYSSLTDLFEVTYVEYKKYGETLSADNKAINDLNESEWLGWDEYIKKFLGRPAYYDTWCEIGDEYDDQFRKYMNGILQSPPISKPCSPQTPVGQGR